MRVSVVKEIKPAERRVGLTPAGTAALVADGHEVFVEKDAGVGAGFADEDYTRAGARIVPTHHAWGEAELLVKVKEPIAREYEYLRPDLTVFTYLHLAADRKLTAMRRRPPRSPTRPCVTPTGNCHSWRQ